MNLKFVELDIDWPSDLSVIDLKNYILSKLLEYGEPLRWAITSVTNQSDKKDQVISLEVVLIINQEKGNYINSQLNSL